MKAQLTVTPGMLKVVFKSLYRESHAVIAARELVQNSMDACLRLGVTPRIHLTVDSDTKADKTFVICEDNGIGMTQDQLCRDFFHLGGKKGKDSVSQLQTGGFGIAKMVVLTGHWWNIRTRDIHLDHDMYSSEKDIVTGLEDIGGCTIEVSVERVQTYAYRQLVCMIALSDYSHYKADNESVRLTIVHDKNILLDSFVGCHSVAEMVSHAQWSGGALKPDFKPANGIVAELNDDYTVSTPGGWGISLGGRVAYRMNGLVQYVDASGPEKNVLAVDLITTARPGDDAYPLTNSRESVKYPLSSEIVEWTSRLRVDSLSTSANVQKKETGYKAKINKVGKAPISALDNDLTKDGLMVKPTKDVAIELLDYDGDIMVDSPLAKAWGMILSMITDETFLIGLTGDGSCRASRAEGETYPIYYINPSKIEAQTVDGVLVHLWFMATHEVSHSWHYEHNEKFTVAQSDLAVAAADKLQKMMVNNEVRRYIMNWFSGKMQAKFR